MKETIKTSRTAGYLEKIFRALNAKYFNGELEEPIITIQSTPRAYGHVTVANGLQQQTCTNEAISCHAFCTMFVCFLTKQYGQILLTAMESYPFFI